MTTREEVQAAYKAIEQAEKNLAQLLAACRHEAGPYREDRGAYCVTCNTSFGWSCPSSPDRVCHYFSEGGFVTLVDGTKVPVEEGHDAQYETHDDCLFCHDPDERK